MERQIKFKAKCSSDSKYAGEWVEGGLVQCKDGTCLIVCGISDECTSTYHVDSSTVCQFTGLITEDNTPVYEGDILSNEPFLKGEVSLYKGCLIVLRENNSYVPLYEYISNDEINVVKLKHEGSKFD